MARRVRTGKDLERPDRRKFLRDAAAVIGALATGGCSLKLDFDALTKGRNLNKVKFWAAQYQKINWKQLAASSYDLLVVDDQSTIKGMTNFDMRAKVEEIKESKGESGEPKLAISYISIGEASDSRYYSEHVFGNSEPGTENLLLGKDPAGWEESSLVRYWDSKWRAITMAYVDRIIQNGFDGILMDWVEAYGTDPVKEAAKAKGIDPIGEMIRFIGDIAKHAKSQNPDFKLMALNGCDLSIYADYHDHIDAIVQEHVLYAGDYPSKTMGDISIDPQTFQFYFENLKRFQNAGIPIFHIEYAQKPENIAAAHGFGAQHGFRTYVTTLLLDSLAKMPNK
jgi:uncharacterized protein (TIGR01370 family)